MMIRNVNASRQWIRALRWGNSAVCCGRRGKKDEQEGGEGEETETVAIAGVRVADMRNEGKQLDPSKACQNRVGQEAGDRLEGGVARLLALLPPPSCSVSWALSRSLTSLGCLGGR